MPVLLEVTPEDLLRCRFAVSPLWEVNAAVRVLVERAPVGWHGDWVRQVGATASEPVALLGALQPHPGWTPDFLTPAPTGPATGITDELARVGRTGVDAVRAELLRTLADHSGDGGDGQARRRVQALLAEPDAGLSRVVAAQRAVFDLVLAPHWPRLQVLLQADVAHRAQRLAGRGLAALLADLHPDVRWGPDGLHVDVGFDERVALDGRGLVLMPSAFTGPRPVVVSQPSWQPTLVYPARGVGALWQRPPQPAAALAGLLGRTRATLLTELDAPSTATGLAATHRCAVSTVHGHLVALRAAGLLTARRAGRRVDYARTPLGDALVGAAG